MSTKCVNAKSSNSISQIQRNFIVINFHLIFYFISTTNYNSLCTYFILLSCVVARADAGDDVRGKLFEVWIFVIDDSIKLTCVKWMLC